LLTKCWVLSSG